MDLVSYIYHGNTEILYLSKHNQIHNWFCKRGYERLESMTILLISHHLLKALRSDINKVLRDNSLASTMLPPREGDQMGSQKIDDAYFDQLRFVKQKLKEIDRNPEYNLCKLYYRAQF